MSPPSLTRISNVDDSMSELEKLQAMDAETEPKTVTGARPPGTTSGSAVGEAGMGTQASERERALRSVGDVGRAFVEAKKTPSR